MTPNHIKNIRISFAVKYKEIEVIKIILLKTKTHICMKIGYIFSMDAH